MAQYAVYETQKTMVVYYVEADSPDQAYQLVRDMGVDEYDERVSIMDTDILQSETCVRTEAGAWQWVEQ